MQKTQALQLSDEIIKQASQFDALAQAATNKLLASQYQDCAIKARSYGIALRQTATNLTDPKSKP